MCTCIWAFGSGTVTTCFDTESVATEDQTPVNRMRGEHSTKWCTAAVTWKKVKKKFKIQWKYNELKYLTLDIEFISFVTQILLFNSCSKLVKIPVKLGIWIPYSKPKHPLFWKTSITTKSRWFYSRDEIFFIKPQFTLLQYSFIAKGNTVLSFCATERKKGLHILIYDIKSV